MRSNRPRPSAVITQQVEEGDVLAPAQGRVLTIPVTVGAVVMPGETIAKIAANAYVLRLELPERHARFIEDRRSRRHRRPRTGRAATPRLARASFLSSIPSFRMAA